MSTTQHSNLNKDDLETKVSNLSTKLLAILVPYGRIDKDDFNTQIHNKRADVLHK